MEIGKLVLEFTKVLAWPIFTLVLVLLFKGPISDLIRRIKKGSLLGGIEFEAEKAEILPPSEQKRKLEAEVKEAAESLSYDKKGPEEYDSSALAQKLELAETLVLKDIEVEYGGNLRRQVYLYGNTFDAVTWTRRGVTAIEVKVIGTKADIRTFRTLFEKAENVATQYKRNIFSFVLAIVTIDQSPEDREGLRQKLVDIKRDMRVPIEVRTYDLLELEQRYGVSISQA
ncbi:MAG: hypothetical protein JXR95_00765 [Deltaproteobacteria bacterium]|nr:hypothetical protein [Deltaproteobacteria bacterium]